MAGTSRIVQKTKPAVERSSRKRARGSGAVTVYEDLRRDILGLRLEPGTLLDETELARRFKLSRSPVREALIRLSTEGLVQTLRNRSSIVAPLDVLAVPSYLDALELIYRLTTRLAALNRSPAQLAAIQDLQKQHAVASRQGDLLNMIRVNHEFHEAFAQASGNSIYVTWMRQVLDQGQRIIGLYLQDLGEKLDSASPGDHLAMVRAIETRDPDAAELAARRDAEIISARMKDRLGARPSGNLSLTARPKRH